MDGAHEMAEDVENYWSRTLSRKLEKLLWINALFYGDSYDGSRISTRDGLITTNEKIYEYIRYKLDISSYEGG